MITYGALRNAYYGLAARYARGGNMRYVRFGQGGFRFPESVTNNEEAIAFAEKYIETHPELTDEEKADIRARANHFVGHGVTDTTVTGSGVNPTGRDSIVTGSGVNPTGRDSIVTGSGVNPGGTVVGTVGGNAGSAPAGGGGVWPAQITPGTILVGNTPSFITSNFRPSEYELPVVKPVETLYDELSDALRDGDMEKAREIRDKIRSHPDFGSYLAGREAKARYDRDIDKDTKAAMAASTKKFLEDIDAYFAEEDKARWKAEKDEAIKWLDSDEFQNAFAVDLDDYVKPVAEEDLNEEPLYSTYDDMYRNASRKDLREYVRSGEYAGPNGQQIVPYVSSRRGRREVARSIKKDWRENGVDDKYRNAQPVIGAIDQMRSVQRASARDDARAEREAKREAIRNIRNGTTPVQRNGGVMMRTFIDAMRRGGRL